MLFLKFLMNEPEKPITVYDGELQHVDCVLKIKMLNLHVSVNSFFDQIV